MPAPIPFDAINQLVATTGTSATLALAVHILNIYVDGPLSRSIRRFMSYSLDAEPAFDGMNMKVFLKKMKGVAAELNTPYRHFI